jgi:hypothetical protein
LKPGFLSRSYGNGIPHDAHIKEKLREYAGRNVPVGLEFEYPKGPSTDSSNVDGTLSSCKNAVVVLDRFPKESNRNLSIHLVNGKVLFELVGPAEAPLDSGFAPSWFVGCITISLLRNGTVIPSDV